MLWGRGELGLWNLDAIVSCKFEKHEVSDFNISDSIMFIYVGLNEAEVVCLVFLIYLFY